ncbi:hypothetical protein H5V45_16235 [Nocardioides sp. KIGAM211]|uniref:Uncharacterized protein n=1 Tax=Nocardioides luti TaxID=2761101 RepID=A0A7X0RIC9_9ACTN|nr:hypothetical protein [Nocardioides luti]MBB6628878.1 hypothetical protein [Nocardioides luti]
MTTTAARARAGVFLTHLVPLLFLATGLLDLAGLVLSYALEVLALMALNYLRAGGRSRRGGSLGDALVLAIAARLASVVGVVVVLVVADGWTVLGVLTAVANTLLLLAGTYAAGRASGRGLLEAAGEPVGTLWRVAVVLAAAPAALVVESVDRLHARGWDPGVATSGVTGAVGRLVVDTAAATGQEVGVVLASVLVVGKAANEVLFDAWSEAPRQRRFTSRRTRSTPLP